MGGPASWSVRLVILLSALLVCVAAVSNAAMDSLQFHYRKSIFFRAFPQYQSWTDPSIAWKNKWKDRDATKGEVFPLSSTSLVGLTDAWHFFKTIFLACIMGAIVLPLAHLARWGWMKTFGVFFMALILWGVVFETFFRLF